jgi:hypothetical protein
LLETGNIEALAMSFDKLQGPAGTLIFTKLDLIGCRVSSRQIRETYIACYTLFRPIAMPRCEVT